MPPHTPLGPGGIGEFIKLRAKGFRLELIELASR